jgi:uncharacterized protein with ATP-grasp and redox domains
MRTSIECIGCLARQAVDIARLHIPANRREVFIREVLKGLAGFDYESSPPIMAMEMYEILRNLTAITDPFAEIKAVYNDKALALYPRLKEIIAASSDPTDTAIRIAVAGNIIDFAAGNHGAIPIEETLKRALVAPFAIDHMDRLRRSIDDGGTILYLADNAGEIVFDRVFIEEIGPDRVTSAVRDVPIINDATQEDAAAVGLSGVCTVISSGSKAPGTPLEICSDEFRDLFYSADSVIAKGQGNYETLDHAGRDIFFLFMVKCPIISREVGVAVNSFIAMLQSGSL